MSSAWPRPNACPPRDARRSIRAAAAFHPRCCWVVALSMPLSALAAPGPVAEADIEKRIDALLARMTLEEKIGQLHQIARTGDPTGPAARGTRRAEPGRARPRGPTRLHAQHHRSEGGGPAAGPRTPVPPRNPADPGLRRDPRLSHRVPHPARPRPRAGTPPSPNVRRRSRRRRPRPSASTGRSPRWWTSRAIRAGGESWRALAKTRSLGAAFAAARVRRLPPRRASPPAPSTTWATAPPRRGATTTRDRDPGARSARRVPPAFPGRASEAGAETFMSAFN